MAVQPHVPSLCSQCPQATFAATFDLGSGPVAVNMIPGLPNQWNSQTEPPFTGFRFRVPNLNCPPPGVRLNTARLHLQCTNTLSGNSPHPGLTLRVFWGFNNADAFGAAINIPFSTSFSCNPMTIPVIGDNRDFAQAPNCVIIIGSNPNDCPINWTFSAP